MEILFRAHFYRDKYSSTGSSHIRLLLHGGLKFFFLYSSLQSYTAKQSHFLLKSGNFEKPHSRVPTWAALCKHCAFVPAAVEQSCALGGGHEPPQSRSRTPGHCWAPKDSGEEINDKYSIQLVRAELDFSVRGARWGVHSPQGCADTTLTPLLCSRETQEPRGCSARRGSRRDPGTACSHCLLRASLSPSLTITAMLRVGAEGKKTRHSHCLRCLCLLDMMVEGCWQPNKGCSEWKPSISQPALHKLQVYVFLETLV